jgi:hypothetical protein
LISTIPANADVQQLQQLYRELSAVETLYRSNKVVFFEPLPQGPQKSFFADSTATIRLVLGSNRSGKSAVGSVEAIAHSLGYRPWLSEDHPDRIVRLPDGEPIPVPNVGRIVAENYQQAINQIIWPKIQEWAPMHLIKRVKKDQRGIPVWLEWKNGSLQYLMSYDQDPMVFEGTAGHYFYCDEPPPRHVYIGLKRGLVDYGGHCWLAMTPIMGTGPWIHEDLVSRANEPDTGVKLYYFSIWDNCVENGGYLTRAAIEEFLDDLREDEIESRVHAKFFHLTGLVYKEWRPEPPFWTDPFDLPASWPRVCVIDPHPQKPCAVLWAACSPHNQWFVYRALFDHKLKTIKDVADRMKQREGWTYNKQMGEWTRGSKAEPVSMRIIDSSSKQNEPTSGTNIWKMFAANQIWCQLAQKRNAQAGFDAIHEAFKLKNEWAQPSLVIFNTCSAVKQNLMNFCFDDWASPKQRELKGPKQEYRPIHDDFIACLRYIYQAGLNYNSLQHAQRREERQRESSRDEIKGFRIGMAPGTQTGYDRSRFGRRNQSRTFGSS